MPVLCIAGPTASGKTACALALAEALPIDIISVDSALVYRGMDIGTAKPDADERARVPHHLIDILEPSQAYSAARFVGDARRLIADVQARGRIPVLVGGTMLYFKALFDGLDSLPAADAAIRSQIEDEALALGWPALHAQLAQVDPTTAARLAPNDAQRIQRALEVWRVSGQPLSSLHTHRWGRSAGTARHGDDGPAYTPPDTPPDVPPNAPARPRPGMGAHKLPLLSLEPRQRVWLHERIALRFAAMLRAGFLDEVRRLRARGDLHPGLPSIRCVGYRQAWEAMDVGGEWTAAAEAALAERSIAATRQLAKRQITWLRSMAQRQVLACDEGNPQRAVVDWARRTLGA